MYKGYAFNGYSQSQMMTAVNDCKIIFINKLVKKVYTNSWKRQPHDADADGDGNVGVCAVRLSFHLKYDDARRH